MNNQPDQWLLREYAERHAEAAFDELVRRHVDLVYSAALRMVRDAHLAEDVTQGVFVALSRSAGQLTERPVLSGWLHRTTQHLAANVIRSDTRRRAREQEAALMNDLLSAEPDADWEYIAPHLDAALGELSEPDRDALLLRYFERKSAREMAQTLGTSEEAAQKRLSRAVERLRELLAKRGVTTAAGGLVVLISAKAVQAAPAGLALSISTSTALLGTAVATTTTSTAAKLFAMTTLQKTLIATTLVAAIGVGTYEARQASRLQAQVRTLQQQQSPRPEPSREATLLSLQTKLGLLETQNGQLTNALAQASADKARLETEREQARHSAALYKELVDQARSKDNNSTNAYPTERHLWAAWGRMMRMAAQVTKDDSKLSPEEKAANEAMQLNGMEEMPKLLRASKQYEKDKPPGSDSQPEDHVDMAACMLYGALNLDEQQFSAIYGLSQKYQQEAKEKGLMDKDWKPRPENAAAAQQIMQNWKTEVQPLLNPEQARIFEKVMTFVHQDSGQWNWGFSF